MELTYHGYSCFSIKGKNATVVTDPFEGKLKGNVVTLSHRHPDHSNVKVVAGEPTVFDWPGEYEVSGIQITGIASFHYPLSEEKAQKSLGDNVIYCITVDGIRICHMGDIGHKLTNDMLEKMGDVDILLIPVGGKDTVSAEKAHEIIEQVEPKVVIPMHYALPGIKKPLDPLEKFLKEEGIKTPIEKDELKYTAKAQLPQENMEVIVMKPA